MKKHSLIQLILVLGSMDFLTAVAGSSTTLALPQISRDFAVSNAAATWVVTIGLVVTTILLVMFGHIGDLLSKSTVFVFGGGLFLLGSLVTGLAPDFAVILLGRFVQAVGIAMIMANSMGIVTDNVPNEKRAEALAAIAMFTSIGTLSGPALGGFLISIASWRWIYLFNVPLGLLVLWFGWRALSVVPPQIARVRKVWREANWTGQNLFTLGIVLFFGSGVFLSNRRLAILAGLGILLGLALTVISFVQDAHAKNAWIDIALLKNKDYMISISTFLIVMLVNAVSNILLPFYLQSYLGMDAFASGLVMMGQSVVMLIVTPLAGYLADHWNRYSLTLLGLIFLTLAQAGYALYPKGLNYFALLWPIVLNGVGMALFLSPNNALTMDSVPKNVVGVAGSLNSLARTFGMTIGMSYGSLILFAQLPGVTHITPSVGAQFLPAFARVFYLGFALSLVGILIVIYRIARVKRA